ncbi:DUF7224 domain-containing protein [Streptomyces eurythermus]
MDLAGAPTEHYWVSSAGLATLLLNFAAPACAAAAAWEGYRAQIGGIRDQVPVRVPLRVAAAALLPIAGAGLAGMVSGLALLAPPDGDWFSGLPWTFIGVWAALLAAYTCAGYVLGRTLPASLSLALAAGTAWVASAYPPAMRPDWLRHLTAGGYHTCCGIDATVDTRAVIGPLLLSLGVVAATGIVVHFGRRLIPALAAIVLAVAGTGAAVTAVRGVGAIPETARNETLQCAGVAPEVCLWPEQEPRRARIERQLQNGYRALEPLNMELPESLGASRQMAGVTYFPLNGAAGPDDVGQALAEAILPQPPACAGEPNAEYPGVLARLPVEGWLSLTAGTDPGGAVPQSWPPAVRQLVFAVREMPLADQRDWFTRNWASMQDCDTPPLLMAAASGQG